MKRRFAIFLVLGLVAAACAGVDSDGPSGIARVPTTGTSPGAPVPSENPDTPPPAIVEPCEPPEGLEPFCQPFTYQQGPLRIVWDRWFWGQGMFSRGTVEIFSGADLVLSGPFSDESVMRQERNGDFIFLNDNGESITVVTQQEIFPHQQAALEEAGIGVDS